MIDIRVIHRPVDDRYYVIFKPDGRRRSSGGHVLPTLDWEDGPHSKRYALKYAEERRRFYAALELPDEPVELPAKPTACTRSCCASLPEAPADVSDISMESVGASPGPGRVLWIFAPDLGRARVPGIAIGSAGLLVGVISVLTGWPYLWVAGGLAACVFMLWLVVLTEAR